jgi:hypothetical protein
MGTASAKTRQRVEDGADIAARLKWAAIPRSENEAQEFTTKDAQHVRACLAEGGFIWRERLESGRTVTHFPGRGFR